MLILEAGNDFGYFKSWFLKFLKFFFKKWKVHQKKKGAALFIFEVGMKLLLILGAWKLQFSYTPKLSKMLILEAGNDFGYFKSWFLKFLKFFFKKWKVHQKKKGGCTLYFWSWNEVAPYFGRWRLQFSYTPKLSKMLILEAGNDFGYFKSWFLKFLKFFFKKWKVHQKKKGGCTLYFWSWNEVAPYFGRWRLQFSYTPKLSKMLILEAGNDFGYFKSWFLKFLKFFFKKWKVHQKKKGGCTLYFWSWNEVAPYFGRWRLQFSYTPKLSKMLILEAGNDFGYFKSWFLKFLKFFFKKWKVHQKKKGGCTLYFWSWNEVAPYFGRLKIAVFIYAQIKQNANIRSWEWLWIFQKLVFEVFEVFFQKMKSSSKKKGGCTLYFWSWNEVAPYFGRWRLQFSYTPKLSKMLILESGNDFWYFKSWFFKFLKFFFKKWKVHQKKKGGLHSLFLKLEWSCSLFWALKIAVFIYAQIKQNANIRSWEWLWIFQKLVFEVFEVFFQKMKSSSKKKMGLHSLFLKLEWSCSLFWALKIAVFIYAQIKQNANIRSWEWLWIFQKLVFEVFEVFFQKMKSSSKKKGGCTLYFWSWNEVAPYFGRWRLQFSYTPKLSKMLILEAGNDFGYFKSWFLKFLKFFFKKWKVHQKKKGGCTLYFWSWNEVAPYFGRWRLQFSYTPKLSKMLILESGNDFWYFKSWFLKFLKFFFKKWKVHQKKKGAALFIFEVGMKLLLILGAEDCSFHIRPN